MAADWLILDLYLDEAGGAFNFTPLLEGCSLVVRPPKGEALPPDPTAYRGIVASGSAASICDETQPWLPGLIEWVEEAAGGGVPYLGVCFGHQLLARALCGPQAVGKAPAHELGWFPIARTGVEDPLFDGVSPRFTTFLSHYDEVRPTPGLQVLAHSPGCAVQAFRVPGAPQWGIQFHPEMGRPEIEALVHDHAREHPELVPAHILAEGQDSAPLARTLLDNFQRQARQAVCKRE